jgi:imidazolonepropionase-like amidohydrolase
MKLALLAVLAACGTATRVDPPVSGTLVLRGATGVDGTPVELVIAGGRIVAGPAPSGAEVVELTGKVLVPAFIDSHVHLAYQPSAEAALPAGGVVAVVDLAAPVAFLGRVKGGALGPLHVIAGGPMLTGAPDGYPLASWGKDGYGLACGDPRCATGAVGELVDHGARVIKVAVGKPPVLDDRALLALVEAAHARKVRVAAHALRRLDADRAAAAGADLLAHTPVEALPPESIAAWRGRAVISTLEAFGAEPAAIANLAALRKAGTRVLYGTDLGNSQTERIDGAEIDRLVAAGMDGLAVLEAGTRAPARYWGWDELGGLEVGKEASLLVLDVSPQADPQALARPARVMIRGAWTRPAR